MRTARSARMQGILGASLIALALPIAAVADTSDSKLRAITGGSVDAITGGSALAITGGSVDAITGGSALAITGGSVDAITGGSALAITGVSVDAITGGSALAITGGSVDAITGGSALAITGGSVFGSQLILAGPVASIDFENGTFSSLGQNVAMAGSIINSLKEGDFVAVSGSIAGAGLINADNVVLTGIQYVPGATEVFVTGIPTSVNYSLGTAEIGGLNVNYTSSLGGDGFEGIGAAITVIGTQPMIGGVMLSDRVFDRTSIFLGR
jgi:hypothetical protein